MLSGQFLLLKSSSLYWDAVFLSETSHWSDFFPLWQHQKFLNDNNWSIFSWCFWYILVLSLNHTESIPWSSGPELSSCNRVSSLLTLSLSNEFQFVWLHLSRLSLSNLNSLRKCASVPTFVLDSIYSMDASLSHISFGDIHITLLISRNITVILYL